MERGLQRTLQRTGYHRDEGGAIYHHTISALGKDEGLEKAAERRRGEHHRRECGVWERCRGDGRRADYTLGCAEDKDDVGGQETGGGTACKTHT